MSAFNTPYNLLLISSEQHALNLVVNCPKNRASKISNFPHYNTDAPV
jgi:hypothetical protein